MSQPDLSSLALPKTPTEKWWHFGRCPRRTPVKKSNPKRKRAEFARCYGSKARQKFVQSLPCSACGVHGYSVNAHLLGNGGMSRKGDYTTVGPLCRDHFSLREFHNGIGCHTLYDDYRWLFDGEFPDFDAEKVTRETEELFRASLGSAPGGQT